MDGETMELKDIILSTLAELEDKPEKNIAKPIVERSNDEFQESTKAIKNQSSKFVDEVNTSSSSAELLFLQNVRERILVLFEGFQSPNIQNIEAKIDLTLNFLEYLLASIDEHLEKAKKPSSL